MANKKIVCIELYAVKNTDGISATNVYIRRKDSRTDMNTDTLYLHPSQDRLDVFTCWINKQDPKKFVILFYKDGYEVNWYADRLPAHQQYMAGRINKDAWELWDNAPIWIPSEDNDRAEWYKLPEVDERGLPCYRLLCNGRPVLDTSVMAYTGEKFVSPTG